MKGAMQTEWDAMRLLVGVENLLPVAPEGDLLPTSKLSPGNVGKVPSKYGKDNLISGVHKWTQYTATHNEVDSWSRNRRYSVSVILGREVAGGAKVYALDIDIGEETLQDVVYDALSKHLGDAFPWRTRGNSPRRLYPVLVRGDLTKRVLTVGQKDGKPEAVELLGIGQQFVAAGTHPSGARYAWRDLPFLDDDILPGHFPALDAMQFELLWADLHAALPVIEATERRAAGTRRMDGEEHTDETAEILESKGWVLSVGRNGERFLRSPREHLYSASQEDGDTSVCYFPAGCGGYERGHFVSLHASDAGLTDGDWLEEFGVIEEEFEELDEPEPVPAFRDRAKDGKIPPTLSNLMMAANCPAVIGHTFRYDEFTQRVIACDKHGVVLVDDPFISELNTRLQDDWRFADMKSAKLLEAIVAVSRRHKFDSLKDWASDLKWDGVARCGDFFSRVWEMPFDDYHQAVGLYFWSALAGRALVPGIQADMAPVLISREQGKRKGKALRALAPDVSWFVAMDLGESRTERIRQMRGKCIVELEEMQGAGRREVQEIRSFLTEMVDTTRDPYERIAVDKPRRCIFVATTNDEQPLNDGAGNRRWLPMEIADDFDPVNVVSYIETWRDQLWAEAVAIFRKHGVMWEAAQSLARPRLNQYEAVSDSVEAKVMRFLQSSTMEGNGNERWCDRTVISAGDIVENAFPTAGARERAVMREAGVILRRLGYTWAQVREEGVRVRKWVRREPLKLQAADSDFQALH